MRLPLDNATALSPTRSVVVEACAGSGKTWLLVSRLRSCWRSPSRKVAQEVTDRLWLRVLALEDDATVRAFLRARTLLRRMPCQQLQSPLLADAGGRLTCHRG